MIGNWLRASSAALRPSSTSCDGEYLFGGGVIRVCAETTIEVASASEMVVAQNLVFMFLSLCKNDTGKLSTIVSPARPLTQTDTLRRSCRQETLHFRHFTHNPEVGMTSA